MKAKLFLSLVGVLALTGCSTPVTNPLEDNTQETDTGNNGSTNTGTGDNNNTGTGTGTDTGTGDTNTDNDDKDDDVEEVIHVQSIRFEEDEVDFDQGDRELVGVIFTPSNATNKNVTYTSSNQNVAIVDHTGTVLAVGAGNATITVTTEDGNKTATCLIRVADNEDISEDVPVTSVSLNRNTLELEEGEQATLAATILPNDATNKMLNWVSSDTEVAQVGLTGKVTAGKKAGTATITVNSIADPTKKDTCRVTVTKKQSQEEIHEVTMQDYNILHCWDWKMSDIRSRLSSIKDAGFKTIQISPMQPQKEPQYSDWWRAYQPLGFKIAGDGESKLGSKNELKAMCEEAEELGIKVIVDVVANHLAEGYSPRTLWPDVGGFESTIYDNGGNKYLHTLETGTSDSSVEYTVRGNLGNLPDLKTETDYVQQRVLSLCKEYLDVGIDGFRFDAAKHIETPDDGNFASNFWPTVINGATAYAATKGYATPYYYGEILNTPGSGRDFSSYTKYMSVTDSKTGYNVWEAVTLGDVAKIGNESYNANLKANKVILWGESHDTFANTDDSGYTRSSPASVIQGPRGP